MRAAGAAATPLPPLPGCPRTNIHTHAHACNNHAATRLTSLHLSVRSAARACAGVHFFRFVCVTDATRAHAAPPPRGSMRACRARSGAAQPAGAQAACQCWRRCHHLPSFLTVVRVLLICCGNTRARAASPAALQLRRCADDAVRKRATLRRSGASAGAARARTAHKSLAHAGGAHLGDEAARQTRSACRPRSGVVCLLPWRSCESSSSRRHAGTLRKKTPDPSDIQTLVSSRGQPATTQGGTPPAHYLSSFDSPRAPPLVCAPRLVRKGAPRVHPRLRLRRGELIVSAHAAWLLRVAPQPRGVRVALAPPGACAAAPAAAPAPPAAGLPPRLEWARGHVAPRAAR
jgi:hypothetical protein